MKNDPAMLNVPTVHWSDDNKIFFVRQVFREGKLMGKPLFKLKLFFLNGSKLKRFYITK